MKQDNVPPPYGCHGVYKAQNFIAFNELWQQYGDHPDKLYDSTYIFVNPAERTVVIWRQEVFHYEG